MSDVICCRTFVTCMYLTNALKDGFCILAVSFFVPACMGQAGVALCHPVHRAGWVVRGCCASDAALSRVNVVDACMQQMSPAMLAGSLAHRVHLARQGPGTAEANSMSHSFI